MSDCQIWRILVQPLRFLSIGQWNASKEQRFLTGKVLCCCQTSSWSWSLCLLFFPVGSLLRRLKTNITECHFRMCFHYVKNCHEPALCQRDRRPLLRLPSPSPGNQLWPGCCQNHIWTIDLTHAESFSSPEKLCFGWVPETSFICCPL